MFFGACLALFVSACSSEPGAPAPEPDAGVGADVSAALEEATSTVVAPRDERWVVAEFVVHVDPERGVFDVMPVERATSSMRGLRTAQQGLFCGLDVDTYDGDPTTSPVNTVDLWNVDGSFALGDDCGPTAGALPYSAADNAICADFGIANFYSNRLTDVYAEVESMQPSDAFRAYRYEDLVLFGLGTGDNAAYVMI